MTLRRTLVAAALVLAVPAPARSQIVFGHVLDQTNGRPLPMTAIMLLDSTGAAVRYVDTDSVGRFRLLAPRAGRYQLYLDQLAYQAYLTDTLTLAGDGPLELLLRLEPLPVELDPLVVTTERRRVRLEKVGFYRRERFSMGYMLGPDQIRELRAFRTTDLLRQIPAVQLRWSMMPGGYLVSSRRRLASFAGAVCPMKIVVDGVTTEQNSFALDDVVPVQDVMAVEVYPGTGGVGAPVRYRSTDAFCGVVLIWTTWGVGTP